MGNDRGWFGPTSVTFAARTNVENRLQCHIFYNIHFLVSNFRSITLHCFSLLGSEVRALRNT